MNTTSIEWTDATWNPTRGCSRVSRGCDNCYAMHQAHRFPSFAGLTRYVGRNGRGVDWTGCVELIPSKLDEPLRWRKPRRAFVNSMSDLFHEALPDGAILRVFEVMARCPQHTFQILTKRPARMLEFCQDTRAEGNVWVGVSVEDQATADERIPLLLQTPAAVRFVSYEPALGPVLFSSLALPLMAPPAATRYESGGSGGRLTPALDWLIVGGESGPGARPFDVAWARSAVRQCREAGVPIFVKQLGRIPTCAPDERRGTEVRFDGAMKGWTLDGGRPVLLLKSAKGGDPSEWPKDLRVREFPKGRPWE